MAAVLTTAVLASCGWPIVDAQAPASTTTTTTSTTIPATTTTTSTTSTTTTTTVPLGFTPKCPQFVTIAREVGWPLELLERLDAIAYRESRCDDDENSHNPTDPAGGSYGAMQVNCSWVTPNRWYPDGYLSRVGITDCEQLLDQRTNAVAALELCRYSINKHDDCWVPWRI